MLYIAYFIIVSGHNIKKSSVKFYCLWQVHLAKNLPQGGILALRAHCALLLDYAPPEEPLDTPLGNTLRIRRPKMDWRGP